jgi:hypothetical protein
VLKNHLKGQVPVQTLRDYVSVSTSFGGAALLFISILVGLSKTGVITPTCRGQHCSAQNTLDLIRFASVIVNFAVVS